MALGHDALDVALDLAQELERANVPYAIGGALVDADPINAARQQGMFVARLGDFRLDLFVASIPFSWQALHTRVRAHVRQRSAWFLSAEALSVFKLLFFRGKDQVDLERLVAQQGPALDAAWVRAHLAEMMGEDDPRVAFWDQIVS